MKSIYKAIIALSLLLASPLELFARNVDLSTVPKRNTVQLTIYNSEDLTLVRETRAVTFRKGVNPLQFSWAGTLIDPTSVEMRFLSQPDKLEVLDTTFPHDKPQMLYWNVQSEFDGEATIEITYFTSGITWSADYIGLADKEEKQLGLEGFVRISNNSGEEYEDAQIRLVVGTINLVEKIAQLAHVPMSDLESLSRDKLGELRRQVAGKAMSRADHPAGATASPAPEEKQIIKEGLSEYFIYTIEGTETITNGWSKRMRSFEGRSVPFKIQYRYRPQEYGEQLVRMYLLTNNQESKLGTTPLPNGTVRLFRDNGRDGMSFLTQQEIKYVPIGDKIEVNLGADRNVIFELVKLRTSRDEIWMQMNGVNAFQKVGQPGMRVDLNSSVVGWDDHEIYSQRVRNYTSKPIEVEVRRAFPGHVVFRSQLAPTLHDFQTVAFTTTIEAGKQADHLFEVLRHQGRNAKQSNVTIEPASIAR